MVLKLAYLSIIWTRGEAMKTTVKVGNKLTMISEMTNDSTFQILEYENLSGISSIENTININRLQDCGATLKQVKIILDNSSVKIQSGALSFMKGNVSIKSNIENTTKFSQMIFKNRKVNESMIKPIIQGQGELFLESSIEYFTLIELEDDEIIIDDSIFYACEEEIEIYKLIKKTSQSIGEDEIQLKLKGSGIVLLKIQIHESEILRCKLYKDRLIVKDDLVILRTGNIQLSVENSGNTIIRDNIDNDDKVDVYSGIGEVWIVPTKKIYREPITIENEFYDDEDDDYDEEE